VQDPFLARNRTRCLTASSSARASAVTTDAAGNVYAFQRGLKADPVVVFDSTGKYLRS
jgi:hypothetical protein